MFSPQSHAVKDHDIIDLDDGLGEVWQTDQVTTEDYLNYDQSTEEEITEYYPSSSFQSRKSTSTPKTPELIQYYNLDTNFTKQNAEYMLSNMNQSVDPCENFYDFACQGWIKSHPYLEIHTPRDILIELENQTFSTFRRKIIADKNQFHV